MTGWAGFRPPMTTPTPRDGPRPTGGGLVRGFWFWATVLAAVTGISLAILWERHPRKNPEGR